MTDHTIQHGVQDTARLALHESNYQSLRRLRCEFDNGRLLLRGEVESFYLKQLAQWAAIRAVPEEVEIDNQLAVSSCCFIRLVRFGNSTSDLNELFFYRNTKRFYVDSASHRESHASKIAGKRHANEYHGGIPFAIEARSLADVKSQTVAGVDSFTRPPPTVKALSTCSICRHSGATSTMRG